MYRHDDIVTVDVPDEIVYKSREFAKKMQPKYGSDKYRPLRADWDSAGYLGHWAVQSRLELWGIQHESTIDEIYTGGDSYDLKALGKLIDVKTSSIGKFSEKYFYNYSFYILKDWTDDPKSAVIDDYIMVQIERDLSVARILGVISRSELLECPVVGPQESPIKLKYENYHVVSRNLTGLRDYVFR